MADILVKRTSLLGRKPVTRLPGASDQLMNSLKTLFDILDKDHIGLVPLSEIEKQWREDAVPNLPGVIDSLRSVSPSNGMLDFKTFVLGLKTALAQVKKDKSQKQHGLKKKINVMASDATKKQSTGIKFKKAHPTLLSSLSFPLNGLDTGNSNVIGNDRNQRSLHQKNGLFGRKKHRRSNSSPFDQVFSATSDWNIPKNRSEVGLDVASSPQNEMNLSHNTNSSSQNGLLDKDSLKHAETSNNHRNSSRTQQNQSNKKSFPSDHFCQVDSTVNAAHTGQYGNLKRSDSRKSNKLPSSSRLRSMQVMEEQTQSCTTEDFHEQSEIKNEKIEKNVRRFSDSNNKIKSHKKASDDYEDVKQCYESNSNNKEREYSVADVNVSPRQLTTPLPPGRRNGFLKEIKPPSFFNSPLLQGVQLNSTEQYPHYATVERKRKKKENRRHTLNNGVHFTFLNLIKTLDGEKKILAHGLELFERGKILFQNQLEIVDGRRRALDFSDPTEKQQNTPTLPAGVIEQLTFISKNLSEQLNLLTTSNKDKVNSFSCSTTEQRNENVELDLLNENKKLNEEIMLQKEKISQLEKEKLILITKLFQAKAESKQESDSILDTSIFI